MVGRPLFVAIEKVENPKVIEALVRQPGIDLSITTEGGYLEGKERTSFGSRVGTEQSKLLK